MFETKLIDEVIGDIDSLIYENYVIYLQSGEQVYTNYTSVISADVATVLEYEETRIQNNDSQKENARAQTR